jgi:hypothetical protein
MIRTTLIAIAIIATAATAIAGVSVNFSAPSKVAIEMNDVARTAGPLVVEQCAVEDCSDTPANS